MKILRIEHVQVAIPLGGQDRARAFYSGVLGFSEIQKPASMAERKSIWFVAGAVNLHLGIEADFHPAKRDRKSTRLNSSHDQISYAVFCLKKKKSLQAGHEAELEKELKAEIALYPGYAETQNNLGVINEQQSKSKEAAELIHHATGMNPP